MVQLSVIITRKGYLLLQEVKDMPTFYRDLWSNKNLGKKIDQITNLVRTRSSKEVEATGYLNTLREFERILSTHYTVDPHSGKYKKLKADDIQLLNMYFSTAVDAINGLKNLLLTEKEKAGKNGRMFDDIANSIQQDRQIISKVDARDNLSLPESVFKLDKEIKKGDYVNGQFKYPGFDEYARVYASSRMTVDELLNRFISRTPQQVKTEYENVIKANPHLYEYTASNGIPPRIRSTGNEAEIDAYLQDHDQELTFPQKHYLNTHKQAIQKARNIKTSADLTMAQNGEIGGQLPFLRNDATGVELNVRQPRLQTSGHGCWSCSAQLMLQGRGSANVTQEDIRAYRPNIGQDEVIIQNDRVDNSYNEDSVQSMMEHADAILQYAPNSMIHELEIEPYSSSIEEDGYTSAAYVQNTVNFLKTQIEHAIRVDRSPVSLRVPGHYITITGIYGNTVKFQDSVRKAGDRTPANHVYTAPLSSIVTENFFHRNDYNGRIESNAVSISWLSDIKLAADHKTIHGVPSEYVYMNPDGTVRPQPEGMRKLAGEDYYTGIHRNGILVSRGAGDEIAYNAPKGFNYYGQEGVRRVERVYLPKTLNAEYLIRMQQNRSPQDEANLTSADRQIYKIKEGKKDQEDLGLNQYIADQEAMMEGVIQDNPNPEPNPGPNPDPNLKTNPEPNPEPDLKPNPEPIPPVSEKKADDKEGEPKNEAEADKKDDPNKDTGIDKKDDPNKEAEPDKKIDPDKDTEIDQKEDRKEVPVEDEINTGSGDNNPEDDFLKYILDPVDTGRSAKDDADRIKARGIFERVLFPEKKRASAAEIDAENALHAELAQNYSMAAVRDMADDLIHKLDGTMHFYLIGTNSSYKEMRTHLEKVRTLAGRAAESEANKKVPFTAENLKELNEAVASTGRAARSYLNAKYGEMEKDPRRKNDSGKQDYEQPRIRTALETYSGAMNIQLALRAKTGARDLTRINTDFNAIIDAYRRELVSDPGNRKAIMDASFRNRIEIPEGYDRGRTRIDGLFAQTRKDLPEYHGNNALNEITKISSLHRAIGAASADERVSSKDFVALAAGLAGHDTLRTIVAGNPDGIAQVVTDINRGRTEAGMALSLYNSGNKTMLARIIAEQINGFAKEGRKNDPAELKLCYSELGQRMKGMLDRDPELMKKALSEGLKPESLKELKNMEIEGLYSCKAAKWSGENEKIIGSGWTRAERIERYTDILMNQYLKEAEKYSTDAMKADPDYQREVQQSKNTYNEVEGNEKTAFVNRISRMMRNFREGYDVQRLSYNRAEWIRRKAGERMKVYEDSLLEKHSESIAAVERERTAAKQPSLNREEKLRHALEREKAEYLNKPVPSGVASARDFLEGSLALKEYLKDRDRIRTYDDEKRACDAAIRAAAERRDREIAAAVEKYRKPNAFHEEIGEPGKDIRTRRRIRNYIMGCGFDALTLKGFMNRVVNPEGPKALRNAPVIVDVTSFETRMGVNRTMAASLKQSKPESGKALPGQDKELTEEEKQQNVASLIQKAQEAKISLEEKKKGLPQGYETYRTLHTGYFALSRPANELTDCLACTIGAYAAQKTGQPYDENTIRSMAEMAKENLALDNLSQVELVEALKDEESARQFAIERENKLYGLEPVNRSNYIVGMRMLKDSIDTVIADDPGHVTQEYRRFANAVSAAAALNPIDATPADYRRVNLEIMNSAIKYQKGRKSVRSNQDKKNRFDSTLDAMAIIIENGVPGTAGRIMPVISRINEVRGVGDIGDPNIVELEDYGVKHIRHEYDLHKTPYLQAIKNEKEETINRKKAESSKDKQKNGQPVSGKKGGTKGAYHGEKGHIKSSFAAVRFKK